MHDAWCMMHDAWCMMHDAWCMMHDAWCMMMHESGEVYVYMMRYFLGTNGRTDVRTDEQGDSRSRIHDPDTSVYDVFINVPWSLTLMHVCMMHISMILGPWSWYIHVWCIYLCSLILDYTACVYDAHIYDPGPWLWCMCVWCTYLWSWTLILKHACMCGACIYDAANFVTNGPTNERTRRF